MPSKTSDTRENQKKSYDQRIQDRRADLEKKGIALDAIKKDKVYEHLLAKRRAIMKAIAAIDAGKARNEPPKEPEVVQAAPKEKKAKKEKPEKAASAKAGD